MGIVILTGAGLSAESGLGTFRDAGGLWTQYPLEDVATPQGFARDPALVHGFYNARREQAAKAQPNAAHHALARLQAARSDVTIVTQNVDGLHEAAGSKVLHMHGRLAGALCHACGARWEAPLVMDPADPCPVCSAKATRPDVVWFSEIPYYMDDIADSVDACRMFVAIGTSGQVYPAAGFVRDARRVGAQTIEINLERTDASAAFDTCQIGPATQTVPAWVDAVLAEGS